MSTRKRALFIDRDGTLVKEPPVDYQLDSLEKLEFVPKVMRNLYFICERLDFEFVMVSNQDGLGTPSFPEETFWPAHNLMLKTLEGEGIVFDDILIDPSFPEDNSPNRKPRTGRPAPHGRSPERARSRRGCSARWSRCRSTPGSCRKLPDGGSGRSWYGLQCPTAHPSR